MHLAASAFVLRRTIHEEVYTFDSSAFQRRRNTSAMQVCDRSVHDLLIEFKTPLNRHLFIKLSSSLGHLSGHLRGCRQLLMQLTHGKASPSLSGCDVALQHPWIAAWRRLAIAGPRPTA
jgi:hypothetical protein